VCDVQRCALGQAVGDVEENNVTQLFDGCEVCERAADVTCADKGNLGSGHGKYLRRIEFSPLA